MRDVRLRAKRFGGSRRSLDEARRAKSGRRRTLLQTQLNRGKCGEEDVADDLKARRGDLVERVPLGMPRRVIEVDDVYCRYARGEKWQVVVVDFERLVEELAATELVGG